VTAPIEHGYPDYGRFSPQQDILLLNVENDNTDAAVEHPLQFVGHVPYVYMLFQSSVNHFSVDMDYYADSAGTIQLFSQQVIVRQGGIFVDTLPTLGPFLSVTVTPSAINSHYILQLSASHHRKRSVQASAVGNLLLRVSAVSIGAGATLTSVIDNVTPGIATWSVDTNVADFFSEVEAIDHNGLTYLIDRIEEKVVGQKRTIFLPPCSIRCRTANNTAAAGTFYIIMNVPPLHPET
jgi:hypothetical protein